MATLVKYTEKGATPTTPAGTVRLIPDKVLREMLELGFVEIEGEPAPEKEKVSITPKKEKAEIVKPGKTR